MKDVVVVDYGCGNILSVVRAFEHLGHTVGVTSSPNELYSAPRIVIPGVGAFPTAVRKLDELGLRDALLRAAGIGTPILGICLGMQLLFTAGYEHGESLGLGLVEGEVRKMPIEAEGSSELRLPEVGWRRIHCCNSGKKQIDSIFSGSFGHFFYFVHSFEAKPQNSDAIIAEYERGGHAVVAAVASDNIFGVQYHPEKSGPRGLEFLQRFISFS